MAETYEVVIRLSGRNETSQVIGQVQSQLSGIERQAQASTTGMRDFGRAVQGAVAGFILNQVRQFGEEMYRVGTEVRIANDTFGALEGGSRQAAAGLEAMRGSTGGIISDLTLMHGASKFLSMGIAQNNEELSRFTELAVKLGASMGNSASESLDSFASLMANESLLRLDTFGISSERVRQRIDELLASGEALNRSDAFRLAVLEEGGRSLDRLGSAADSAATPVARLQTRFENLSNSVAEFLSRGVEAGAMLGEMGLAFISGDTIPQQQAQQESARIQGWSQHITEQILNSMGDVPPGMFTENEGLQQFVENVLRYGPGNVDLFDARSILTAGFNDPGALGPNPDQVEAITYYQGLVSAIQDYSATLEEAARIGTQQREALEAQTRAARGLRDVLDTGHTVGGAFGALFGSLTGYASSEIDITRSSQQLAGLGSGFGRGSAGGLTLFSEEDLQQGRQLFADYQAAVQRAGEMRDQGIISQEAYTRLTSSRDLMTQMANEIERGAAAFQNMTLAQALGQGGGGLFGEIGDQVLNQLRSSGLSDDQIAQIQDTLDLTSGRQTEASLMLRDEVAPLLAAVADTYGSNELIVAMQRVQTALEQGRLTGASDFALAESIQQAVGYRFAGGGGAQFTVAPGDTVSGLAQTTGLSMEQIMAAAGITNPRLLQPGTYGAAGGALEPIDFSQAAVDAPIVADSMTTVSDTTAAARDNVDEIAAQLDQISGTSYEVDMHLNLLVNDPMGIMALFANGGLAGALQQVVQDNGGTVPGANPRAPGGGSRNVTR